MAEDTIKSGPEIVKDFIGGLKNDSSLDQGTVETIRLLDQAGNLTPPKLQQALEARRRDWEKHG